jgi:tRNA(Ile)-lysidine synthase
MKNSDTVIRPLLNLTKEEILKFAKDYGISFVQDASNQENDYSRNYLRNVILPQVEEVYPGLVNSVVKFGKRCEEIQNFILSQIDESLIELSEEGVCLKQQIFEKESFFVREYLKRAFDLLKVFSDIEAKHYTMIYELSKAEVNKEISLPHKLVVRKTYGGVKILKQDNKAKFDDCFEFIKNGEILFGAFKIVTRVISANDVVYGDALYVDANKISTSAVWRTRKPGDKFSKIGTGSKKLNDYLTNNKVDHELRNKLPILAAGETVLVVAGDDVSENVKIDASTDEIVKISFETI